MGRLTEDMTQLCGEIHALRHARKAFINDLKQGMTATQAGVAAMRNSFRNARAEMARMTRVERAEFIFNLEKAVASLKKKVAVLRQEFAMDIKSAHQSWSGRDV
jgi:hypothetical protein